GGVVRTYPWPYFWRLAGVDGGLWTGDRRGDDRRRPGRVTAQAPDGRQGFGRAHPRPRRSARPHGQPAVLRPGGGPVLARIFGMKRIAVLGSTGSIGRQTLDVVRWHPDEFEIVALAAARPSADFDNQLQEFRPRFSCLTATDGVDPLMQIACEPDIDLLIVATSGTVGFRPTIAALESGKPVALANKETLIMAGHLATEAAAKSGAPLLPIDSEHSAIWQCLQGEEPYAERVARLLLTASGGAFRDRPVEALDAVTPAEALQHPTWTMGPKITIDSATLMNKGLEVIEAHWLFGLPLDRVDVVIHHQSVIHSLVEFVDGSVKAQLGVPDMRLPIQYAMAHPRRVSTPAERLDLAAVGQLT